jgi:hypothetical protein
MHQQRVMHNDPQERVGVICIPGVGGDAGTLKYPESLKRQTHAVMAALVAAIMSGSLPLLMAGTCPAMTRSYDDSRSYESGNYAVPRGAVFV